ncbi:hypothetical protein DOTSEDRAFT_45730, partial [Dothistroma septosporum NZE10]
GIVTEAAHHSHRALRLSGARALDETLGHWSTGFSSLIVQRERVSLTASTLHAAHAGEAGHHAVALRAPLLRVSLDNGWRLVRKSVSRVASSTASARLVRGILASDRLTDRALSARHLRLYPPWHPSRCPLTAGDVSEWTH